MFQTTNQFIVSIIKLLLWNDQPENKDRLS